MIDPDESKIKIEADLGSSEKRIRIDAIMHACFNVEDVEWIQDRCIEMIEDDVDFDVRNLAIICIGHTARIHKCINLEKIKPVLVRASKKAQLAGSVQDVIDDIEIFTEQKIAL